MAQFKQFLSEGGHAVPIVSRINQPNVAATLDDIYKTVLPFFKIKKSDTDKYVLLGSAGKKKDEDSSGDLDVAISIPHLMKVFKIDDEKEVIKKVEELVTQAAKEIYDEHGHDGHALKDFFKLMPGLMTFSMAFPINNKDGKQEGQFVQLDFMPADNIDMIGWAMSAAHHSESNVKGAVRVQLLSNIIKYADMKITKKDPDGGDPLEVKRYYFNPKSGIYYITQVRKMGKNGKPTKATEVTDKKFITGNKDKIAQFLFGAKHTAKDIMTFEQVWNLFLSDEFKFPKTREESKKHFLDAMEKEGVKLPI